MHRQRRNLFSSTSPTVQESSSAIRNRTLDHQPNVLLATKRINFSTKEEAINLAIRDAVNHLPAKFFKIITVGRGGLFEMCKHLKESSVAIRAKRKFIRVRAPEVGLKFALHLRDHVARLPSKALWK